MWKRLTAVAAAAALVAVAAGPALADKKDNSIRFAYDQVIENVDPYFNNVRLGVIIGANVWDTLIYRDPETNEYKGQLATSWKWIDDKTLEFELRQGVKFHNGEDFDADDVVYTLNFASDPANKSTRRPTSTGSTRSRSSTSTRSASTPSSCSRPRSSIWPARSSSIPTSTTPRPAPRA